MDIHRRTDSRPARIPKDTLFGPPSEGSISTEEPGKARLVENTKRWAAWMSNSGFAGHVQTPCPGQREAEMARRSE